MKVQIQIGGGNMCFIPIPDKMAEQLIAEGHKRVICKVDGQFEFHCAIQKIKNGPYCISMGKKTLKAGNLSRGQEIEVKLIPDHTKYQCKLPEELEAVLASDPDGNEKFHKLSPGKQRTIIYFVTGVKSPDKRIERALKVIENIKMGYTKSKELLK